MATDMKRFTISVTDEMAIQLDRMKQGYVWVGLETMQRELGLRNDEGASSAP